MNDWEIEILSIDITNQCHKECPFCYNSSASAKTGRWSGEEVVRFAVDCIAHGVKAVSLGGGEPFEHPEIFSIIKSLYPLAYLTVTTNGLPLLKKEVQELLKEVHPDKIHISIHNPESQKEVNRVISQIRWLSSIGVTSGVNLLVSDRTVVMAQDVYRQLSEVLSPRQIIILPMRYGNTPAPKDLFKVAGNQPFQSSSCLTGCRRPANFASVSWDKQVSSCSFTPVKGKLAELTYQSLVDALDSVGFLCCG